MYDFGIFKAKLNYSIARSAAMLSTRWIIENSIIYDCSEGVLQTDDGKRVDLKYNENILLNQLVSGVFDKHALMEAVWGKVIVTDSSYHKLIFELRGQLERIGLDPKLIKTVPRRGCMFVGLCEPSESNFQQEDVVISLTEEIENREGQRHSEREHVDCKSKKHSILSKLGIGSRPATWRNSRFADILLYGTFAVLGVSAGWAFSDFLPDLYITKIKKDSGMIYIVGLIYKDIPKLPSASGDVFYIKNRKGTSTYLCDRHDRSDLNCENQISF